MQRFKKPGRGPWIVAATLIAALAITSLASGQAGSALFGGKRNPSANNSQTFSAETEIIANNGTYGTRQSNKSDNGGGAIYGCRSKAGGTEKGNDPCVRASNLSDGRAFEFSANGGTEVGRITGPAAAAPFTTSATGVATGLNADRVDGKDATQLADDAKTAVDGRLLFAAVSGTGTLAAGSRGATSAARTGEGAYSVVFGKDVSGCALTATEQTIDDAGAVGVELQADKTTVRVVTRAGGATNTNAADRPFHLTATC
ncbi:MAG: hypothetical protein V9E83_00730 [Baekduia sp.]